MDPSRHSFVFNELESSAQSNKQPYFRMQLFFNKRPDITNEQFNKWWETVHADLCVAAPDFGVFFRRYVQFHPDRAQDSGLEALGLTVMRFDAAAEFYLSSLDDWSNFVKSEYYQQNLIADGLKFMVLPMYTIIGHDHLIYGGAIDTCGGSDGILPNDERLKWTKSAPGSLKN